MIDNLKAELQSALPKNLLIDLYDVVAAKALAAFELIRDHAELDEKRAKEAVGQVRFRMQEKGFEEVCTRYGGTPLIDGVIPGTEFRVFQPFRRFQSGGVGIILGLATMPEPKALPVKNMSRRAGITLNAYLTPGLGLDDFSPKPGDIFVLLLIARDPMRAGRIEEVAVGVIDSAYESFVFYEPIDSFLSGYGEVTTSPPDDGRDSAQPLVRLKRSREPFVPPEKPQNDNETEHKA